MKNTWALHQRTGGSKKSKVTGEGEDGMWHPKWLQLERNGIEEKARHTCISEELVRAESRSVQVCRTERHEFMVAEKRSTPCLVVHSTELQPVERGNCPGRPGIRGSQGGEKEESRQQNIWLKNPG